MRFHGLCLFTVFPLLAQNAPTVAPGPADIAARANSSLAIVLAGKSPNQPALAGIAVAIRQSGVLLTFYRLIKDARAVQVRLNNGETFDRVQLLGVDARRDIAAIRITAALAALPAADSAQPAAGDKVTLVSLAAPPQWANSEGAVFGYSMADEVPGAGQGFRVIRFTATGLPPIFNGGVLLDGRAGLLGLASAISLAVPADSVLGLADSTVSKTFASGAALKLPGQAPERAAVPPKASSPHKASSRDDAGSKEDRRVLLRDFKTIYIDADNVKSFDAFQLKAALEDDKIFQRLNLAIVQNREAADTVLTVRRSLGTDYPFELSGRNKTLLLRGSALGYTGEAGAQDVARVLSQLINQYRPRNQRAGRPDAAKLPADPGIGLDDYK